MDNLDQLLDEILEVYQPIKKQEENLKIKLHQQFDLLEQFINQNPDQQKEDRKELYQKMQETDKVYIDSQKIEFLIKIMNLITQILKQKLFIQYDLNKYLTYLKYMIVQYFNDKQFENIKNGIVSYFLNCSCLIKGNNKLDFFTTKSEGYYFLSNFLQLKKIYKNHFINQLTKNYFDLPHIENNTSCSVSQNNFQNQIMSDSVIIM